MQYGPKRFEWRETPCPGGGSSGGPARCSAVPWSPPRYSPRAGRAAGRRREVVDLVFQGPLIRFELKTTEGSPIVAHVGPDENLPLLRPGDRVQITWDADGGRLLRRHEQMTASPAVPN